MLEFVAVVDVCTFADSNLNGDPKSILGEAPGGAAVLNNQITNAVWASPASTSTLPTITESHFQG